MNEKLNIDDVNRKILSFLDWDAATTLKRIATHVDISPEAVHHRVKRLERDDTILGYHTVVNYRRLGWHTYRCYLSLQAGNQDRRRDLISSLKQRGRVGSILESEGKWQVNFAVWCRRPEAFFEVWNSVLNAYKAIVLDDHVSEVVHMTDYSRVYLNPSRERDPLHIGSEKTYSLSETQRGIVKHLAKAARTPKTEIAKSLDVSPQTVRKHVDVLKQHRILLRDRALINTTHLDRNHFKIHLSLSQQSESTLESLQDYCEEHDAVVSVTDAIGGWDFEFEAHLKEVDELYDIVNELNDVSDNVLEQYHYLEYTEEHQRNYFPLQ